MRRILPVVAALGALGLASTAHASYMVDTKQSSSGILTIANNSCTVTLAVASSTSLVACLNGTHTGQGVDFSTSSGQTINYDTAKGQDRVDGSASFDTLTISLAGGVTFGWLSFGVKTNDNKTDKLQIAYTDANGNTVTDPTRYDLKKSATNGFTLSGVDFKSVTLTDTNGKFNYIDHVRFDDLKAATPPVNTPEPATVAILGMGLLGMGVVINWRRRGPSAA